MRPPAGAYVTAPGPRPERAERAAARLAHLTFYDPEGLVYGLPTYPWRMAPEGYLTRRQLRAKGLRPGGQPVQAQLVWWHGGRTSRNGRLCRERRVAWLYRADLALPVRPMTPGKQAGLDKAMRKRRTCPECQAVQPYCISKFYGACNACVDRNAA